MIQTLKIRRNAIWITVLTFFVYLLNILNLYHHLIKPNYWNHMTYTAQKSNCSLSLLYLVKVDLPIRFLKVPRFPWFSLKKKGTSLEKTRTVWGCRQSILHLYAKSWKINLDFACSQKWEKLLNNPKLYI